MDLPGYGKVAVDIAYGGAFYAFTTDTALGVNVHESSIEDISNAGWAVTCALKDSITLAHPDSKDLSFLYGTIITDGKCVSDKDDMTSSICIFADKEVQYLHLMYFLYTAVGSVCVYVCGCLCMCMPTL